MGFSFRKSINFGPLRLNFSKRGVGVSAGVRGARVSKGPSGTYLNVGRGGLSYRKKLDAKTEGRRAARGGTNWLIIGLSVLVLLLFTTVLILGTLLLFRVLGER
ncbi:MAG TPA: DUF4236 domain-containing protein [Pyrinomonadaceae bacterium]|nr:DUF4236 domain-containing protein [Pyrinomonadaceae bacterium]